MGECHLSSNPGSTALNRQRIPRPAPAAILGQTAILAGAVGTAAAITWYTRGLLPYVAAVGWALLGVIVTTAEEGHPQLALAAGLGLSAVLATTVLARRADHQPGVQPRTSHS